ncbi:MAG: iron chaperone [Bacteroidia bacterium]
MKTVDEYIAQFPKEIQQALKQVREVIIATCPEAVESISYAMPAYKLNGKPLAYFAGYKNHIGFYATPNGHEAFKEALAKYKQGKGSIQFPLTEPMPLELIKQIVLFRIENIKNPK